MNTRRLLRAAGKGERKSEERMNKMTPRKEDGPNTIYRDMLLEKKRSVLASLGIKSDTLARLDRIAEDDQAPISHDEFVSSRLNTLEYAQLKLVNEALDRIESGDYGICLSCDRPIPGKRLRALPWARFCVACQEQMSAPDPAGHPDESARPVLTW
jgi:DnaK suppressor protein